MKRLNIILPIVLMLTVCNLDSMILKEDIGFYEEGYYQGDSESSHPLESCSYLDESHKIQLRELYRSLERF